MMRARRPLVLLVLSVALVSCGGRQGGGGADPVALIRQGRYKEARVIALKRSSQDQRSRAIVALTYVAESPTEEREKKAVASLTENAGDVRAAAMASEMLDIAFELPEPVDSALSLALAEVALGAVSFGPYAPDTEPSLTVGAASRDLAVAVLERTGLALDSATGAVSGAALLTIWNSCFSLTGGSFESGDDVHAWRLFRSIAEMAVFVHAAEPGGDLANVLLGAAVTVIETNPDIAVAVRCDLASPYDDLKKAMAYNRENLARLENAVKDAAGCTRGTFAPTVR
jgi:hypothetical protein